MNKLRQKSWYYAAVVTLFGVILAGLLVFVAQLLGNVNELIAINIDAGSYIVGATLAVGVAGVSLFDWVPVKVKKRMRWLLSQPLARQAAVWFLTSILVLSFVKVLRSNLSNEWTAAFDIGLNAAFTVFGVAVLYRLIGVLFAVKKTEH